MDLDLSCVASFVVLLQERHYGRAATRLHLSPSALTKRVQRLERQLGVTLVDRGATGFVGPTAAGRRFATAATTLLAHAEDARRQALGTTTTVRLGVPGALGDHPSREVLRQVSAQLGHSVPGARLECVGVPFTQLTRSLREHRVDVVWTVARSPDPAIRTVPLAAVDRLGVVACEHPMAGGGAVELAAFADLPMLYHPGIPAEWMELWFLGDVRPAREARLVPVTTQRVAAVLEEVAHGRGVTVLHEPLAARVPPQVRCVRLVGAPPVSYSAAHRRADRSGPVLALLAALREVPSAPAGPTAG